MWLVSKDSIHVFLPSCFSVWAEAEHMVGGKSSTPGIQEINNTTEKKSPKVNYTIKGMLSVTCSNQTPPWVSSNSE